MDLGTVPVAPGGDPSVKRKRTPKTHEADRNGAPMCGKPGKVVATGATCKACARIKAGGYGRTVSPLFRFAIGARAR